jgi:hypothetical protein
MRSFCLLRAPVLKRSASSTSGTSLRFSRSFAAGRPVQRRRSTSPPRRSRPRSARCVAFNPSRLFALLLCQIRVTWCESTHREVAGARASDPRFHPIEVREPRVRGHLKSGRFRIRLTGVLREKPWKRGFFMDPIRRRLVRLAPRCGLTGVSVEPPGAVARRGLAARAGYEPPRKNDAITITFGDAIPSRSRFAPKLPRWRAAGRPLRGPV